MAAGVIIGNFIILYSLFAFIKNAFSYKYSKEIEGFEMVYLSPKDEFRFMIRIILTHIFPFLCGCLILTMELSKQGSDLYNVDVFIVALTLITVAIELFLKNIGYPMLYSGLKGRKFNEKINYYEM